MTRQTSRNRSWQPVALALAGAAAALCAGGVGAERQDRRRQLPVRPGGRRVRRAGQERRQVRGRRAEQGRRAGALQQERLRRRDDRGGLRRRGRQHHDAGAGVPQPGAARQRRCRHRLRRLGQLPRHRAGRRGAEEASSTSSTAARRASSRTPSYSTCSAPRARDHGHRRRGALREGAQRQGRVVQRHQPELRLGPGLVGRLRAGDEEALPRRQPRRRPRRCRSSSPASTTPRSRRCSAKRPTSSTRASGTATSRR